MKVIIVGCGAIGQVFALFLQKAGVELGLYDRPETVEKLKKALEMGGLPLFRFRKRDSIPYRLENYQVLTDVVECQRFSPDQIWFATPSPVYYSEWFREFLLHVPSQRVVCFAPEGGRPEFFPEGDGRNMTGDRMVFGGITFMSWQGDLDGGGGQSSEVNFWLPPFIAIPLTGTKKACREVAVLLKNGGFRATVQKQDARPTLAPVTAVMTAFMAGLELSGWTFGEFRKSPWLKCAASASREGFLSQNPDADGMTRALLGLLCSSKGFVLVTLFLPLLFPFDLEKYCKFHYTKTRDQTLNLLNVFERDGKSQGFPMENTHTLLESLLEKMPGS